MPPFAWALAIIGAIGAITGTYWFIESRRRKAFDPAVVQQIREEVHEVKAEIGRIAEYLDGLPSAEPEIRDPFTEGMEHKVNYEYDEAIRLFRQALAQGPAASQEAALLILIGNCFREQTKLEEAEGHYKEAEAAAVHAGDQEALAAIYNGTALIHKAHGDYDEALQWFQKSAKIKKKTGDRAGLATIYNNIGTVCDSRGDYDQALGWYHKSLKIEKKIGDRAGLATTYNNIGLNCDSRGDFDQALEWYNKSLKIKEGIADRAGLATTYNNVGSICYHHSDYDKALEWYHKSLKITEEIGDRDGLATTYNNIGGVYYSRGDYDQALDYGQRALRILEEIGAKDRASQVKANIEKLKAKRKKGRRSETAQERPRPFSTGR